MFIDPKPTKNPPNSTTLPKSEWLGLPQVVELKNVPPETAKKLEALLGELEEATDDEVVKKLTDLGGKK